MGFGWELWVVCCSQWALGRRSGRHGGGREIRHGNFANEMMAGKMKMNGGKLRKVAYNSAILHLDRTNTFGVTAARTAVLAILALLGCMVHHSA